MKNPIQELQIQAIDRNNALSVKYSKAAINNMNPNLSVIDTIRGLKARAIADNGAVIVNNMGTGYNIINTAISQLKEIRAQLESIKQTVQSLNGASPADLSIAQNDYKTNVLQIVNNLRNLNFNGVNLTDGTLAPILTGTAPTDTGISNNASAYKVISQIDGNGTIGIAIARLIAGAATAAGGADPAIIPGIFEPLYGLSAGTPAAEANRLAAAAAKNAGAVATGALNAQVAAYAQQVAQDALAAGRATDGSGELKIIYVNAAIDMAATLQAGDLTDSAERIKVTTETNKKIAILDRTISSLTGAKNSITSAESIMNAQIIEVSAAADNYTGADYNEIVANLAQVARSLAVLLLCYAIQERIINANVSSLSKISDTIPT